VLVCCGTLLERLHGPGFMLAVVAGTTAASNALAVLAHGSAVAAPPAAGGSAPRAGDRGAASIASTSGGIVALGTLCALRYGRWAAWPGLPLPLSWLLAPVLVADISAAAGYFRQLPAYKAALADHAAEVTSQVGADAGPAAPDPAGGSPGDELEDARLTPSGFELAVALAACRSAETCARAECRPPAEEIASWREDLERASEASAPLPPDGAFWADAAGAALTAVLAVAARGRLRARPVA